MIDLEICNIQKYFYFENTLFKKIILYTWDCF